MQPNSVEIYAPKPFVDVLIPHYQNVEGLTRTLSSIAAQDWLGDPTNRLHVIVLDDGSAPAIFSAVETYCEDFRAVSGQALSLKRNEMNLGRPEARNRLLDLAEAPYLAWLDAGDTWYPEKLRLQFAHLLACYSAGADPAKIWVTCAYDIEQTGRRETQIQNVSGDQFNALLLGRDMRAYLWTVLASRSAFAGRFDPHLMRLQDLDYFLDFVTSGGEITVPDETDPLCCYFKTAVGRDARQIAAGHAHILQKHAARIRQYPHGLRRRLRHEGAVLAARFALANGAYILLLRYLAKAFLASPAESFGLLTGYLIRRLKRGRSSGTGSD